MKITTSIKIDKDVKSKASKLAHDMGLPLSAIINASLKQFVKERRISFSVEPELNEKSKIALRKALKEVKENKNLVGPFDNTDDLKKSLLN